MFGTEKHKIDESNGIGKYVGFGNHKLMITGFEIKTSSTGKKMISMNVETPPVTDAGFAPDEKALNGGKVGRVNCSIYVDFNSMNDGVKDFEKTIQSIAKRMDKYEEVFATKASTVEEYTNKVAQVLKGKFAWFQLCAEEYQKKDSDKTGFTLKLGRYGYVGKEESDLKPFDKENKYHYKHLEKADSAPVMTPHGAGEETPW